MHRFYASTQQFSGSGVTLDLDETRHLRDVLRLRTGDEVNVFDGKGSEFRCTVSAIGKKDSQLSIIKSLPPSAPESSAEITVAACQLPAEKFDLVVQKSVELGVKELVPLLSIRTEAGGSAEKRRARWEKIALAATKQCGRATLMSVASPVGFAEFAGGLDAGEAVFFFTERDGSAFPAATVGKKITAFFGPKGGWDDSELQTARACGFHMITLGGRILRAETAAIALTAILQHRFGDIN